MSLVQSYRDLIVWQKSMRLSRTIYEFSRSLPKEETYGLISQMRRAVVSVPANIAEGQARRSTGEFRQFLGIAHGSLAELETLVLLSSDLGYATTESVAPLLSDCEEVSKMLRALRHKLGKCLVAIG